MVSGYGGRVHSIYYDHVSSEILLSLKIQIISIIIGGDNNERYD